MKARDEALRAYNNLLYAMDKPVNDLALAAAAWTPAAYAAAITAHSQEDAQELATAIRKAVRYLSAIEKALSSGAQQQE